MDVVLNDKQVAVLRWVADGCPAGVYEGDAHKISASALRTRDVIRVSGRGSAWRAELTDRGRAYLDDPPPPKPVKERRPRPAVIVAKPPAGGDEPAPAETPDAPELDPIVMPADLRGAHPTVRATRDAAKGQRPDSEGRIEIGPQAGIIHCVVTRELLRRGLLVVQALLAHAEKRSWSVEPIDKSYSERAGVAIVIRGHEYRVELHEKVETLPFTQEQIERWRNQAYKWEDRTGKMPPPQHKRRRATGQLSIQLPNGYGGGRATWTAGVRGPLESKLPSILETLEDRAQADDIRSAELARRDEERRREQEVRAEHQRRHRIEQARLERLMAEVQRWRQADDVRAYVGALRDQLPDMAAEDRHRVETWCAWADDWATRTDPARQPQLIIGLDHERDSAL